jgi:alpha-galactosidase
VLTGNIPNAGEFVPGIPRDFEVEIPLLASKRGIQGIRTNRLPDAVVALALREMVAPANIELQAYEEGSRELLLQLIMLDPWTRSEEQACRLLDEIFALPYHQELREHFG